MNPSNFPDDSRENPSMIQESDPFIDYTIGSRENPEIIPDSDDDDAPPGFEGFRSMFRAMETMESQEFLGFLNRDVEDEKQRIRKRIEEEERVREENLREKRRLEAVERIREESAKRHKEGVYRIAKKFAFELHSELKIKSLQKQSNEEEEVVKGGVKVKSLFKEAKEVIDKRKEKKKKSVGGSSEIGFSVVTERKAPSLMEMCTKVLAENSESIQSLHLVPDHLKTKLSSLVSDLSKIDARFMQLLIEDSPSEVFSKNCVDLLETDLVKLLCDCDRYNLKVLSLDLCGRAMTENAITEFLKHSPFGFPALTRLSLKGAFGLTDNALALIARSAPLLQFINLSECSFLTFNAVKILANYFGQTLRGLNIGGCQGIKACDVLKSSLLRFMNLNYLSVAGLERIHDILASFFASRGANLTDLSIASCYEVTDRTIWTIGKYCPHLEALDISDIDNLTDESLEHITDGCRYLNSVKLTKNRFSDEAVAAFLEVRGGSLNQLCLNHVRNVGQEAAISLAKNCKRLHHLDLSWCRKLTEGELRLILSSCSLLKSLKLFGWTHVKDEFLEELSRAEVCITGLKMTSIFANLDDSYPSVDAKFF
ncbi:hypothetical protein AALP_AA8G237900 [Arabis alpina]|uniref:F-box/LRR-repeat protein 15-like leucin rich repeat domain-containing protein n=1 Tax=Arabis alpina TaxID=50452 RepID=A0A087G905_ARAAL|nr:hypothetical protein AALP_AA8G237900 [Arabis alpina]